MFTLPVRAMHRMVLAGIVDAWYKSAPHTLSEFSQLMKLSDKLNLSEEERAKLNYHVVRRLVTKEGQLVTSDDKELFDAALANGAQEVPAQAVWWQKAEGKEDGELIDVEVGLELSDEQKQLLYNVFKDLDEKKQFQPEATAVLFELATKIGYEVK